MQRLNQALLIATSDHLTEDLCHMRLRSVGGFLDLLMADLHRLVESSKVCNDTDTKDFHATVTGYDDLWHGTHSHSAAPQEAIHAVLGWRLKGWSLDTHIHTMD